MSFKRRWKVASTPVAAVPCGPLGDWLSLLRMKRVDFFSLDVEGAELLVLQTIDWSALSVGVLLVECSAVGCVGSRDDAVAALLGPKGLARLGSLRVRHDIWNSVFANESHLASSPALAGKRLPSFGADAVAPSGNPPIAWLHAINRSRAT